MGKHIKPTMTDEEKQKIFEERQARVKEWHKQRYLNKKEQYIKREKDRRERIKEALKLLEEKQGVKLEDIKLNEN